MADVPVEVKKAPQTGTAVPEMWGSFRSDMDRLFDRFARGFGLPSLRSIADLEPPWRSFIFSAPPIDMSEDDKAYKISAELPGLDAKDIEVSVSGDRLVLKGEKRQEQEQKNKNYHLSERTYGSFERSFELPVSVDRENRRRLFKGSADNHAPKNWGDAAATKEDRDQIGLIGDTECGEPARRPPIGGSVDF
jgi:HSP20 family protein